VDAVGYVVVQESLTNVLRHAGASTANVAVRRTGEAFEVTVIDDGTAAPGAADAGVGMGIPGMRSRVEALGGTLEAGPRPGGGFLVRARLPVQEVAAT
jgi:signal transduction histidine kinase